MREERFVGHADGLFALQREAVFCGRSRSVTGKVEIDHPENVRVFVQVIAAQIMLWLQLSGA